MEKFAVDLDRVLDEFELNEDLASAGHKDSRTEATSSSAPPSLVDGVEELTAVAANGKADSWRPDDDGGGSAMAAATRIKVVHAEELSVNREYVVNFGRKLDAKLRNGAAVSDNADGGGSSPAADTSTDDTSVTLDDDSCDSAVDVAPVGFCNDVSVTDDEMERYLQDDGGVPGEDDDDLDSSPSTNAEVVEENECDPAADCEADACSSVPGDVESTDISPPLVDIPSVAQDSFEADEGYEAGEPSPSDAPANDDDGVGMRLQRPTSLQIPGQFEYEPPTSPSSMDASSSGDEKPFASLVATAGSPDVLCDDMLGEVELSCLGKVAPVWVPDSDAPNCMQCDARFTVLKRRHHCRACGKVFCAQCCGTKVRLQYMDNREARVCLSCIEAMKKETLPSEDVAEEAGVGGTRPSHRSRTPNPNNPSEYCSVIPPLQQAMPNAPPPTVMVPVGVLKRAGMRMKGEPKQVMFSDGIRPGGDLSELDAGDLPPPNRNQGRVLKKVELRCADSDATTPSSFPGHKSALRQEYSLSEAFDMGAVIAQLQGESAQFLVFRVLKNLRVFVKIVNLDCCVHRTCWNFTTSGMAAVGQDEIVVLLEMLPDEKSIPLDVFHHLESVYEDASKGVTVSGMGHTIFSQIFLGSREHSGFLYIRPTFQCLHKLVLPAPPYLVGILLQKWETPWAKVFPLRLFLRLGAEYRYYPCPLVSVRFRKPVFCEIGHTIMNLLADFRNYQYALPLVPGLLIHMKDKQTVIKFPRNRYDEVVKALNSSIDHVLALASSFSCEADSHLVCIQGDDGNYETQAINIKDKQRQVTGASFVVFNGALKASSGLTAKSSIVEDGLMLHISSESMRALCQCLRDMKDYVIPCGAIGAEHFDEVVTLQWVDDDCSINVGVKSAIDGSPMDGVSSIRIHSGTDYASDGLVIRWTEVYLMKTDDGHRSEAVDLGDVSESLARACCLALTPHLVDLFAADLVTIALRVTLDAENVGYEIGARGEVLPARFMNDLDCELVPAIHGAAALSPDGTVVLELLFHVLEQ